MNANQQVLPLNYATIYPEWKFDMKWLDRLKHKKYIQTSTEDLNMCLVHLKGMDDVEIRKIILSIIFGMKEALDINQNYRGFDLGISATDEVINRMIDRFEYRLIHRRKYIAGQYSSDSSSHKPNEYSVWLHTFRAMKYPELRYLGRDLWAELTRGLYDANSLFYQLSTKASPFIYFFDQKSVYSTLLRLLPSGLEPRDEPAKLRWKGFEDALQKLSKAATKEIQVHRKLFRNSSEYQESLREFEGKLPSTLPVEDTKKKINGFFGRLWWSHLEGENNTIYLINYKVLDDLEYEKAPKEVQKRRDEEVAKQAKAIVDLDVKVRHALKLLGEIEVSMNFEVALRSGLRDGVLCWSMYAEDEITDREMDLINHLVKMVKKMEV